MSTVIGAVCVFLLENQAAIASSLIANASYDAIKKIFNFSSLKNKISKFFIDEEQVEEYLRKICEEKPNNPHKPERDIEDIYENTTKSQYNSEIFEDIKEWVLENKNTINETINMNFKNESGFNIGIQNAQEIYNIQGDYNIKND
ncbi:MAG: hypothetical protein FWD60_05595 [Candidatus Azobacteroides sp.]|nr:hypothetical protein [Candidatus Azobacteroides sp.]